MPRVLVVDDEFDLCEILRFNLESEGFDVDTAQSAEEALSLIDGGLRPDLILLDVMMEKMSGFDMAKILRQRGDEVPIIFLTASDEETSVIMGLDIGGDDYVTKPFRLGILMSRVAALLRRTGASVSDAAALESNGIRVELMQGQAFRNGEPLDLTGVEFRLLCCFMQNPNIVLSKEKLYERLWDSDGYFVDDNTLSVYIRRLRMKIEDTPERPEKIVTVRGMGYKWRVTL